LKELGYENPQMKFHYKKPTSNLDKGLESNLDPVFSYQDTNHDNVDDVNIGSRNDNVDKEGSDNSEDHDDSKDSEDSDFECDLKDRINDVHVHMEMFREHTDPNVEWVGPTTSMPEVETNE
ncbi:hypothetical protein Tco_0307022, partial [Tanacetum coccineum]